MHLIERVRVTRADVTAMGAAMVARSGLHGPRGVWLLIGGVWALVFVGDLLLRMDVAVSVLYLIPIAMTLWIAPGSAQARYTIVLLLMTLAATGLCALIGADPQHAPGPRALAELDPAALANRLVGAIAQVVTALIVIRQQRARALEQAMIARLKQALRSSGEFVAVASHELKTPLTGARGYAQFLLRRARRGQLVGIDSQSAEALRLIDDLLRRLHLLTDDLLHVSRLDSGRFDMQPGRLDIVATVRRVAGDLARQAPEHAIQVRVVDDVGAVYADERRIEQVLTNLIGNSVKYSPAGGVVEVSLSEGPGDPRSVPPHDATGRATSDEGAAFAEFALDVAVPGASVPEPFSVRARTTRADQRHLLVSIQDEGIGIPEDERARLFQRFARAANAAEADIPGTGLGLYLCRALVEAQGGRVWLARSEPGNGSTFCFTLPAWHDSPGAPKSQPARLLAHTARR